MCYPNLHCLSKIYIFISHVTKITNFLYWNCRSCALRIAKYIIKQSMKFYTKKQKNRHCSKRRDKPRHARVQIGMWHQKLLLKGNNVLVIIKIHKKKGNKIKIRIKWGIINSYLASNNKLIKKY